MCFFPKNTLCRLRADLLPFSGKSMPMGTSLGVTVSMPDRQRANRPLSRVWKNQNILWKKNNIHWTPCILVITANQLTLPISWSNYLGNQLINLPGQSSDQLTWPIFSSWLWHLIVKSSMTLKLKTYLKLGFFLANKKIKFKDYAAGVTDMVRCMRGMRGSTWWKKLGSGLEQVGWGIHHIKKAFKWNGDFD